MADYLSVTQLTKYLKLKFDRDPYLERVYLTGQVSNFRKRPNHQYFSLKDEGAVIQATMWAGAYKKLGFDLEEGMKLNVVGRIQLYEPNGSYSMIIEKAEPDGIGALALQFEQLRQKLAGEGFFDERHKQALPQFVTKVGVVTSPRDRKSTRLNSSHANISYAVFCLNKKTVTLPPYRQLARHGAPLLAQPKDPSRLQVCRHLCAHGPRGAPSLPGRQLGPRRPEGMRT